MYTTKKTPPEKNSPFNLHEQDQGVMGRLISQNRFYAISGNCTEQVLCNKASPFFEYLGDNCLE